MIVLAITEHAAAGQSTEALRQGFLRQSACIGVRVGPGPVVTGYFPDEPLAPVDELDALNIERVTLTQDEIAQYITP
jgi:hypothetical protein